jgi:hypothetical protein
MLASALRPCYHAAEMRWPVVCDLLYGIVWTLIMVSVWANFGIDRAAQIGLLLAASYFAGGVKYNPPR